MATPRKEPEFSLPVTVEASTLKLKQELFARAYVDTHGNVTEAARRAGYSQASANKMGYENLRKPHVAARIEEILNARIAAHRVGKEEMIDLMVQRVVAAFHCNPHDIARSLDADVELTAKERAALKKITVNRDGSHAVELHDPMPIIAQLARMGGWEKPQQLEVTSSGVTLSGPELMDLSTEELQRLIADKARELPN